MKMRTLIISPFLRKKVIFPRFWPLQGCPYSHSAKTIASLTRPQSPSSSRLCRILALPTHLTQSRASARWKKPCFKWGKKKRKSRKGHSRTKQGVNRTESSAGAFTLWVCSGFCWFLSRQQQIKANIWRARAQHSHKIKPHVQQEAGEALKC